MNKEELENLLKTDFEFQLVLLAKFIPEKIRRELDFNIHFKILKDCVFDEIIPEILKEITPDTKRVFGSYDTDPYDALDKGYNICIDDIKQKAKDLYNITL